MIDPGGPWITSAGVYRHVADDAPPRPIQQLTVGASAPPDLALIVELVRGAWVGPLPLRVVGVAPSAEPCATIDLDLDLPGEAAEACGRVVVPLQLATVEAGVYWFEVVLAETHVTRVPLRLALRDAR